MAWTALRDRVLHGCRRERVWIASQGELVRERAWPGHVRGLPMTGDGRAVLPLGEGHHQLFVGATGSGTTTSARRVLPARALSEPNVAILVVRTPRATGAWSATCAASPPRARDFPNAIYFHPGGWRNWWWARTVAGDGKPGWVPEVFFKGGGGDESDIGLRTCENPKPPPPPPPPPPPSPCEPTPVAQGVQLRAAFADGGRVSTLATAADRR